ncbi:MAG: hypothetical protein OXC05_07235 [Halieaceae bacterium]|nr:hypothetical protein [Halieaceae bacterium]
MSTEVFVFADWEEFAKKGKKGGKKGVRPLFCDLNLSTHAVS